MPVLHILYRIRILEQELRDAAVEEAKSKASKAASNATSSLQKLRDEALAHTDVTDESIRKLSHEVKFLCESNDKYQSRILDLQTVRDRMELELAAAVKEAKRKSSAMSDAVKSWESQKLELERVRDKAMTHTDKGDKLVKKLLLEDPSKCNEYQTKISELQSARDMDRDTAVIKKAGSISAFLTTKEFSKLHMQELKTLHAKVTALHDLIRHPSKQQLMLQL
ncbi:hypothetical protein BDR05DRAFT_999046 [Suillus weaverae]|nr:hypothetical protein BDR05DRAFT_999046 [Suillus weaverae]